MWLSKKMSIEGSEMQAENGSITISSGNTIEAESSVSARSVSSYSPYGYVASPPVGEAVMLLPSADGQAIIGVKPKQNSLEAGEIQITSKGGASIVLRNDGSVVINSLVISKEGVIES